MCRGLCLRITPKGAKSFYFNRKVKGRNTWVTIGPFPDLTPDQARRLVDELNGAVAMGENLEPMVKDPTFEQIFTWYIEHHAKPRKMTWEEEQEMYDRHLKKAIGTRRAADITMDQVSAFHARLGAERGIYSANRNLALLRTVLNKAIKFALLPGPNPAMAVEVFQEHRSALRLNS